MRATCPQCGKSLRSLKPLCATCQKLADQQHAKEVRAAATERVEAAREHEQEISDRKLKFLTTLMNNGGHVELACRAAGVAQKTMRLYAEEDPEFALAWETVQDTNVEKLESEADRRAVGYQKELTYQGIKTGDTVTEYSDNLLMFRLKALRPEKYRDGMNKGAQMSEQELDEALAKMMARRSKREARAEELVSEAVQ